MSVIQLADYRQPPDQPMSKRTFDASLKGITKRIEQGHLSGERGCREIQAIINEYFFPQEG